MRPLPESARITVPTGLAADLARSVKSLPVHDTKAYYADELQERVHEAVRRSCTAGFDELVTRIERRLTAPPYGVVVRGLPFDDGHTLFVAFNRAFGRLVAPPYRKPRAQLVHHIQPETDLDLGAGKAESERLHTDNADWTEPAELISMACARPDSEGGGRSQILDVNAFREEVAEGLGEAVLALFEREPVPWRLPDYVPGGIFWRKILEGDTLRWRRYTIEFALRQEGVEVSAEMAAALERVDPVLERSERICEFLLEAGELLIMDNRRALHGRTAISGDRQTSRRLMLRSWIQRRAAA